MKYIDCHTHSILSPDGTAPLRRMASAAVDAGLSGLCITDHYDLQGEHGEEMPPYDWKAALEQYQDTLSHCAGLDLRLGLELGGAAVDPERCAAVLDQPALDFVIGSVHNMSPAAGGLDFFFCDYPDEDTCYRILDDYVSSMEALAVQPKLYDVLGHIIYPLRYMLPTVSLDRFQDRIAGILSAVIQAGRGIEVNTYRGRTVQEWKPILALYRDLGGTLVTVGSDAHIPGDVGAGISQAYDLLQAEGFQFAAFYKKRKPALIHL